MQKGDHTLPKREHGEGRGKQALDRIELGTPTALGRRAFLRGVLAGVAGVVIGAQLSGCSDSSARRVDARPTDVSLQPTATRSAVVPAEPTATRGKVLLAYFSRAGENYYYSGRTYLEVGNTEVLAGKISRLIGCDVYRIKPVNPYPDAYMETVQQNVREQNANARPAIADALLTIAPYDTVLLGSPIWNVRAPMIMSTFVEGFDFTGKTVFPVTTYAVSGLGTTVRDYAASCRGATIGEGLAVRGEEVRDAGASVEAWLRRNGLL
jgi:flavodoxin